MKWMGRTLIILALLLIPLVAVAYVMGGQWDEVDPFGDADISSYEDCIDAGYPTRESDPPICITASGTTFTGPSLRPAMPDT